MVELSIIIVHYKTPGLTRKCLRSLFEHKCQFSFEVFLVDNGADQSFQREIKAEFPEVKIVSSSRNMGFSAGNNLALKKSSGKYALLLNSDTEVVEGSLNELVSFAKRSNYGVLSCKLLNQDNSLQPNAGFLPNWLPLLIWITGMDDIFRDKIFLPSYQQRDFGFYSQEKEVGWVSGSVMLIKEEVFEVMGYLDEEIFMYGEDVEFCWRAKKYGYLVGWTNKTWVYHLGGGSLQQAHFSQWLGEFRGLLYIYSKYYGKFPAAVLKVLIYLFVSLRAIIFFLLGKVEYSKSYVKILNTL